jgi:hypothetical protein
MFSCAASSITLPYRHVDDRRAVRRTRRGPAARR